METASHDVPRSAAIYSPSVLRIYDGLVLGLFNRWLWRCPTSRLRRWYDGYISRQHLDIGVGTGYFLARMPPGRFDHVTLVDANPACLDVCRRRLAHLRPVLVQADVTQPDWTKEIAKETFDSVAMNYVLHCLPGPMSRKFGLFDQLRPLLAPRAVIFGGTILSREVKRSPVADAVSRWFNRQGIFANEEDSWDELHSQLHARFEDVAIERNGCVAMFAARADGHIECR